MDKFFIYQCMVFGGCLAGPFIYSLFAKRLNREVDSDIALESVLWGAGVAAGLHLLFCCIDASHLVHFVDASGNHVTLKAGVAVKIDMLHRVHIFAGAVATILVSGNPLYKACTKKD